MLVADVKVLAFRLLITQILLFSVVQAMLSARRSPLMDHNVTFSTPSYPLENHHLILTVTDMMNVKKMH